MRLYLDDDSVGGVLIKLLRGAGHDVTIPADVSLSGADDPVHLLQAALSNLVLLSYNHDDYRKLHELVTKTSGVHPGILIVRRENNPLRDMSSRAIVRAIDKLVSAAVPIENEFIILNHWR